MDIIKPLISDKEIDDAVKEASRCIFSIKNILGSQIKTVKRSDNSTTINNCKKFGQQLKLAFRNSELNKSIISIRKELDIPIDGFDLDGNKAFFDWIHKNKETNYLSIQYAISKHPIIESDPSALLDDLLIYEDKEKYKDIERYKFGLIFNNYPDIRVFINHIKERPFMGIFEFILFNKILIPCTNGLGIITYPSDRCIVIALSANTTKRDLIDLWTEINSQQHTKDYNKSKIRLKPKLEEDLKLLHIAAQKDEEIKLSGKKGAEAIAERNIESYNAIDEVFGGREEEQSKTSDLRKLARRRQKINRIKKIIKSK